MGRLGADAFAEIVDEGGVSLDTALSWHLSSNHYPPVPPAFIATCKAAIEAGQDGDWDHDIELPIGCNTCHVLLPFDVKTTKPATRPGPGGIGYIITEVGDVVGHEGHDIVDAVLWKDDRNVATASALIESFHLDSFL